MSWLGQLCMRLLAVNVKPVQKYLTHLLSYKYVAVLECAAVIYISVACPGERMVVI